MIDWSWEPLPEPERMVLRRLAVHAGGATLDSAEAVVGVGDGVERGSVLDLVTGLVDRSLLVLIDGGRYRMPESVAVYARERLDEAGETASAVARHSGYFIELAEHADGRLRGPEQQAWLARLDADSGDLTLAVRRALDAEPAEDALRLVAAVGWYWYLRGRHAEASRLLTAALGLRPPGSPAPQARALTWLCLMASTSDAAGDPLEHGRAALAQYRKISDEGGLARAQALVGFAMARHGQPAEEAAIVDESVRAHQRLGDRWGLATALVARSWVAAGRGELDTARVDVEHSLALFRDIGDRWGQVRAGELLGYLLEVEGDYDRAAQLHREGLRLATELGLWPIASRQLGRLGRLAALAGDYPAAIERYEQALALATEIGFRQGVTFAHGGLGMVGRRQGRLKEAERHFRIMLDIHREEGFLSGVVFALPTSASSPPPGQTRPLLAPCSERDWPVPASSATSERWRSRWKGWPTPKRPPVSTSEPPSCSARQPGSGQTQDGRCRPPSGSTWTGSRRQRGPRSASWRSKPHSPGARPRPAPLTPASTGRRSPGNRSRHTPDPRLRLGDPASPATTTRSTPVAQPIRALVLRMACHGAAGTAVHIPPPPPPLAASRRCGGGVHSGWTGAARWDGVGDVVV